MRLSTLVLRHFRNLRNQELELPPEGVALIGDNAQGKSNFLEAIYYLETLRSFRGARDEQLIAFGEDVFRVVGTTEADDTDEVAGAAGSPGQATGRARVVIDAYADEPTRPGEVLVAPITDPAWTPLFLAVAGVVVDVGAQQSHAAIVARELGIPAVVGVESATTRLRDGQPIEIDGATGTVTVLSVGDAS